MGSGRGGPVVLRRECEVTLIPGGEKLLLAEGERVMVTQALGGTFTVQTEIGYLARIGPQDADALGLGQGGPPQDLGPATGGIGSATGQIDEGTVVEQLRTVFDPEIPVNVVDLGLIYDCKVGSLPDGSRSVEIKMSMTAPGCGMGDVLREDARERVMALPGVGEVDVELVWDPPWDLSRMSDAARLQLGMF